MASKVQRQQVIGKLIGKHAVTNQPQLVDLLADEGIAATQATVSRDLEDLGAVKVRVPGGETVYAIPEYEPARIAPEDQLRRVMGEWVAEVKVSANLVVLRTPPGCAHVVASAIDRSGMSGLIGTVAGDDTLMCVADETVRRPGSGRPLARAGRSVVSDTPAERADWEGVVARTVRRGPVGRVDGVHREPVVRSTTVARRHRRVGRPRARSRARADHLRVRARVDHRRPRSGRRPRWRQAHSCSSTSDEDIHTAIERRVTELAGATGAKLHTGRSRNDQSATDVRRWMKRELMTIARRIVDLQGVLLDRARASGRGVPARLHPPAASATRAVGTSPSRPRLGAGSRCRADSRGSWTAVDVSPLGAGALAGSSLPLDPDFTAGKLGFSARFENSLDAVGSRDHIAEALFALTMVAIDLLAHRRGVRAVDDRGVRLRHDSTTATPLGRRCCRRRRTPTSPNWRGARVVG